MRIAYTVIRMAFFIEMLRGRRNIVTTAKSQCYNSRVTSLLRPSNTISFLPNDNILS